MRGLDGAQLLQDTVAILLLQGHQCPRLGCLQLPHLYSADLNMTSLISGDCMTAKYLNAWAMGSFCSHSESQGKLVRQRGELGLKTQPKDELARHRFLLWDLQGFYSFFLPRSVEFEDRFTEIPKSKSKTL